MPTTASRWIGQFVMLLATLGQSPSTMHLQSIALLCLHFSCTNTKTQKHFYLSHVACKCLLCREFQKYKYCRCMKWLSVCIPKQPFAILRKKLAIKCSKLSKNVTQEAYHLQYKVSLIHSLFGHLLTLIAQQNQRAIKWHFHFELFFPKFEVQQSPSHSFENSTVI